MFSRYKQNKIVVRNACCECDNEKILLGRKRKTRRLAVFPLEAVLNIVQQINT